MKEKIRPIYLQLTGVLAQTPSFDNPHSTMSSEVIWEGYNKIVEKLNSVSGKDYSEFKVESKTEMWNSGSHRIVNGTFFRQQLNGLINHLHAEYFQDERPPFSGEAPAIFQQNQTVSQNTDVQVLMMTVLEVQEKLIKKEGEYDPGTPENIFIKTFKEALKGTKNNIDLISSLLQSALTAGLTLEKLKSIFN